jgi:hypothetical protein
MWLKERIRDLLSLENSDAGGHMQSAGYIEFNEMAVRCELAHDELHELLEYGVLPVLHMNSAGLCFPVNCIHWVQRAVRIRRDYDLDLFGMAVVMRYEHRIDELQETNSQLRTLLRATAASAIEK